VEPEVLALCARRHFEQSIHVQSRCFRGEIVPAPRRARNPGQ
jgi:hypothetical protein